MGLLTFGFINPAMAACSPNVPANGDTITCSGADTTGISGGANNVTLTVGSGASISTTGVSAVALGTGGTITTGVDGLITSNTTTITAGGGAVILGTGTTISSSTGTAIQFNGTAGTAFSINPSGTVTGVGTAIDFGSSAATFALGSIGGTVNGNVLAGAGSTDKLQLAGSGSATFNVNDIGVKYTGFDQFQKISTGTWTLTGTGSQAWAVTGGTLIGDTTSMSGNIAVSSGANVTFNQSTSGATGIVSGAGSLTKTGTGSVNLTGTQTYTGGTTVSGGSITGTTLGIQGNIVNNATVSFNQSGAGTYTGVMSGTGVLTKGGTGTVTLSGANTYSGGTTVSAGTLQGTTTSLQGNVVNNSQVVFNQNTNGTYSSIMSGTGSLAKSGTGTVTLTGINTYQGGTSITGGTIAVSSDANLGNSSGGLTFNGGTLQYGASFNSARNITLGASNGTFDTNGFNSTLSGVISGSGGLIKTGSSSLILTGDNTYTGGTTVSGGRLNVTTSSLPGNVTNNNFLRFAQSTNGTYGGIVSGTGVLEKTGAGIVTLTGVNTYTGGTYIGGGAFNVSADNNLGGAGAINLDGGTLQYGAGFSSARNVAITSLGGTVDTNGFNSTLSGIVSGAGSLTKIGAGTLSLTGTNTYTGGTIINQGTVAISSDANLGNSSGGLTFNGGTLQYGASFSTARAVALGASGGTVDLGGFYSSGISGNITGTGSLSITGNGSLNLFGTNTYTGGTTIGSGAQAYGTLGIGIQGNIVNNGDILSAGGTYSGGTISGTGRVVMFGDSTISGTNTYTGQTLVTSGSTLTTSADSSIGGASSVLNLDNGTLKSGASLNVARNVTVSSGGGTINTNGFNSTISGVVSGAGTLTKTGVGTLTLSGTNTYSGGTAINAGNVAIASDANLGGASGGLTMDGGALQFNADVTSARAVALGSGNGTFNTNGTTSTLSGTISGSGTLNKTGAGNLILSGANTYMGGTIVTAGNLTVNADNNLGNSSGSITLDGGRLRYGTNFTSSRSLILGAGNGVIDTNGFSTTYSGVISGTGGLTAMGFGQLTLTGANTYSGGTTVSSETLVVSADNNLGNSAGSITLDAGALKYGAGFSSARNVALTSNGGSVNTNGFNSSITGIVSGAGTLTKTGAGTLTLSGNNTYTGGTSITGGSIVASSDGNLGDSTGNIQLNNGLLSYGAGFSSARSVVLQSSGGTIFTNGFNASLTGVISGTGALTKSGAGTLSLTGTNTNTGGITVTNGTLNVVADANLGDSTGGLTLNGGTLQYGAGFTSARAVTLGASNGIIDTNSFNSSLSGVVSGVGALTKTGGGTLTLTGTNTYSGGTTISGGALRGTTASLQGNILNNASMNFDQTTTGTYAGIISGTGAVGKGGTGTVTLTGANTYTGGTSISGGILNVSADNNLGGSSGSLALNGGTLQYGAAFSSSRSVLLGSSNGTVDTNGFSSTLSGVVSGTGTLTKIGTGTLTLTGANTYTGGTTVSAGTLLGTTAGLQGNILNNATLTFSQAVAGTYAGIISGTGNTVYGGGATYTLTGANTYTGTTTAGNANLRVSADNNMGASTGSVILSNGTLTYDAGFTSTRNVSIASGGGTINTNGFNSTLSGVISGAGALTKTGTGILTLTGNNTYSGGTTISGGTLNATTSSLQGDVVNNAALTLDQSAAGTYSGNISGTGAVYKYGTGAVTLSGANTYTGGTSINAGILKVGADNNLGATASSLSINGGSLQYGASFDTARNITIAGGQIDTNGFDSTLSGIVSGSEMVKEGAGILTLSGANTYTARTYITGGAIKVSADENLGAGGSYITLNGGTLQYGAGFTTARNVSINSGNGTIDTQAFNSTISGIVSGAGSLTKNGAGTLTLSGANTYTGGTTISAGTLVGTTDSIQGDIVDNAALIFDQTANGTYANILSGTGTLEKYGAGTIVLSGANTYTGNTYIGDGAFQVSAENGFGASSNVLTFDGGTLIYGAGFTSARNIVLDAGDGSIDTNGFNATISGVLSGVGNFVKNGLGNLILSGTNTYAGDTTVSAGRLSVNGAIGGTTTVSSGAELGGNGTTGSIINNGTLSPGNSIGTLNVTGDVTFNSGSIYKVEVDAGGDSDKTIATGALIINGGTVDVKAATGNYSNMTQYTILQGASRTGTFSSVTSDMIFLDPTLSYTGTSVLLSLDRNDSAFNIVAKDETQEGVANAVEGLGSGNDLYNAFVGLTSDQASQALDSLSDEHNAGLAAATMNSSMMVRNIITNRVQNLTRAGDIGHANIMALRPINDDAESMPNVDKERMAMLEPSAGDVVPGASSGRGWWSEVFGSVGKNASKGSVPSQNRNSGGILFGMDTAVGKKSSLGVFGGWERGEVYTDSQMANSDIDTWHGGFYGSYNPAPAWRLSGGFAGSRHSIDTTRHIDFSTFNDTAKGSTSGYTLSGYTEAGYTFDFEEVAIEPFVGLNLTYTSIGSYTEQDGGAANLKVDSISQATPGHTIGVRAGKSVKVVDDLEVTMRGRLGWDHNYGNLSSRSTMQFVDGSTPFDVNGTAVARDAAIVGAGFDTKISNDASMYVNYDGSFAKDDVNHTATLGIKAKF